MDLSEFSSIVLKKNGISLSIYLRFTKNKQITKD